MARFKINSVFSITGPGMAMIGEITGGVINQGAGISLLLNENSILLKIESIETVRSINHNEIGLIVGLQSGCKKEDLIQFIGQTVSITENDPK